MTAGGIRPTLAWLTTAALVLTIADAFTNAFGVWKHLGASARVILLAAEATYPFILAFREAAAFARKHQANHRVAKAFEGSGAPELTPNRPVWLFKIQAPGKLGAFLEAIEDLVSVGNQIAGRTVLPYYLRAGDDVDAWVQMTRVRAVQSRGLKFLTGPMYRAILWHIVVDRLVAAGAPQDAVLTARTKLEELQDGPLYDSLFSPAKLAAIDLTTPASGEHYFSRFFQPLMVAFDEARFVESSGTDAASQRYALMSHLSQLTSGRLRAARLAGVQAPDEDRLGGVLPREVRVGPQHRSENAEAKRFNKNSAVRGILLVAEQAGLAQAEAFEVTHVPGARYESAQIPYDYWTPFPSESPPPYCFLWQSRAR